MVEDVTSSLGPAATQAFIGLPFHRDTPPGETSSAAGWRAGPKVGDFLRPTVRVPLRSLSQNAAQGGPAMSTGLALQLHARSTISVV